MKAFIVFISMTLVVVAGCGNSDNEELESLIEVPAGTATISVDGNSIEITTVSCRAQEYSYSVRASGPTHSIEVEFNLKGHEAEGEFDFSEASYVELYAYQDDRTILYRSELASSLSGISGGETHVGGSAEITRFNNVDEVITVDLDIRCEG